MGSQKPNKETTKINLKTTHSHIPILNIYLEKHQPENIIEWGSGPSTIYLETKLPHSRIVSIENNPEWYQYLKTKIQRATIIFVPLGDGYIERPLKIFKEGTVDLALIDGRCRIGCLWIARKLLKKNGMVMLHDYGRRRYRDVYEGFRKERTGKKYNTYLGVKI